MNDSRAMSKSEPLDELGNGKRTAIIVIAVLVIAALVGYMFVGFRGRHIARNAAAMATPVGVPAGTAAARANPGTGTAPP
jgi:flagellar basal body-associated protein FliL